MSSFQDFSFDIVGLLLTDTDVNLIEEHALIIYNR